MVNLVGQSGVRLALTSHLSRHRAHLPMLSHPAHGVEPLSQEFFIQGCVACRVQGGEGFLQGIHGLFHSPEVDVDLGYCGKQERLIPSSRWPHTQLFLTEVVTLLQVASRVHDLYRFLDSVPAVSRKRAQLQRLA